MVLKRAFQSSHSPSTNIAIARYSAPRAAKKAALPADTHFVDWLELPTHFFANDYRSSPAKIASVAHVNFADYLTFFDYLHFALDASSWVSQSEYNLYIRIY